MLPTGLARQMTFCLSFALFGVALGLFYDLLRAFRVHLRLKRLGTGLMDGLFCLTALFSFLLMMLRHTDGRLRGYLLVGLAGGILLYRRPLSRWVLRLLLWLLKKLGQALGAAQNFVLWLFSFPRGN